MVAIEPAQQPNWQDVQFLCQLFSCSLTSLFPPWLRETILFQSPVEPSILRTWTMSLHLSLLRRFSSYMYFVHFL